MDKDMMGRYEILVKCAQSRIDECKFLMERGHAPLLRDYYKTVIDEREMQLSALHFLVYGTFE